MAKKLPDFLTKGVMRTELLYARLVDNIFMYGGFNHDSYKKLSDDSKKFLKDGLKEGYISGGFEQPGTPMIVPLVRNIVLSNMMLSLIAQHEKIIKLKTNLNHTYGKLVEKRRKAELA